MVKDLTTSGQGVVWGEGGRVGGRVFTENPRRGVHDKFGGRHEAALP